MVAKSGDRLLREDALLAIRKLLPLADVLTPHLPEAEDLLGHAVRTNNEMREAARELQSLGPRNVVIQGGHGVGASAFDNLFDAPIKGGTRMSKNGRGRTSGCARSKNGASRPSSCGS